MHDTPFLEEGVLNFGRGYHQHILSPANKAIKKNNVDNNLITAKNNPENC